jgi:membrane protein YdbS with pleckstrin-like domain
MSRNNTTKDRGRCPPLPPLYGCHELVGGANEFRCETGFHRLDYSSEAVAFSAVLHHLVGRLLRWNCHFLALFQKDSRLPFILFGAIAFFGIPVVAYVGKKLNYARTEYRFHEDRLEFEEGFFNINKKVIKYKNVSEVTLHKGLLQRIYGLGTIYLATLATGSGPWNNIFSTLGFGNVSASGVGIRDVQEPEEIFDKVKSLVDKRNVE